MTKILPTVCVIGAGPSGLAAMRELKARGIPFEAFEKTSRVGGLWVFGEDNKSSAAYRSLHINTSRKTMEFSCFPMPDDYPEYCHNSLMADYFQSFADNFDLEPHIQFETQVENVARLENGLWQTSLSTGETKIFDALIVANGHHWDPQMPTPEFKGTFDGIIMHSHDYKDPVTPYNLRGKNVVVVGMGNSAMDIACELGAVGNARTVHLAIRRGTHILPKFFGSRPVDSLIRLPSQKPWLIERLLPKGWLAKLMFPLLHLRTRFAVGKPQDFGLPVPKHRFGETHPTISSEIHTRLGSGDVKVKGNIKELCGREILFEDGSRLEADAIVYATGYKISFPFFKDNIVDASDNDIALFKRVMDPSYDNLFFVGLIQPLCSIMPIAEVQSRWVARYLTGQYKLPSKEAMIKDLESTHQNMKDRYVDSKRHTIQIECMEYTCDLYNENKEGQRRAQLDGYKLPVQALADGYVKESDNIDDKSHNGKERANEVAKSNYHPGGSQRSVSDLRL